MSLIKLTENLENFKWTDYSKAGTGKSPQQDGTNYFERPNPKSLDQMESKFGTLNTQPLDRGPYGVADYMDGTKQGRGFTPPGGPPLGFTVDMGESKYVIGTTGYTLTPLSHTIAGITSNGPHGSVSEHTIDIQFGSSWLNPVAPNAWAEDFMTLPLAEYVSQHSIEQNDPPITRTFNVPDAYPNNDRAYSVNSQFGWAWPEGSEYLGIHGMPWRGFKLTTTVGEQMDIAGLENVVPEWYPSPPTQVSHPVNHIYLNSEPSPAPSYLEMQFLINYGLTDEIWPYHVLGFEGTHPLIRKDIGERYQIGGVDNWMALQVMRTGDDISRIEKWMETPQGAQWVINQHMLQELNPRSETRDWSKSNLILSIPPLFHATRHWGGDTYMDEADFGELTDPEPPLSDSLLGAGFPFAAKVSKVFENISDTVDKIDAALGGLDFSGRGGRLNVFRNKFLVESADGTSMLGLLGAGDFMGAASKFLTDARGGAAPLGRTPKIPTRYVNSQRGPFGGSDLIWIGGGKDFWDWTFWSQAELGLSGKVELKPPRKWHRTTSYGSLGKQVAYSNAIGGGISNIVYNWGYLDPLEFYTLDDDVYGEDRLDSIFYPGTGLRPDDGDISFTIDKTSNISKGADAIEPDNLIKQYKTLAYGDLDAASSYTNFWVNPKTGTPEIVSPGEVDDWFNDDAILNKKIEKRGIGKKIVDGIGQQGRQYFTNSAGDINFHDTVIDDKKSGAGLGLIKKGIEGKYANQLTDKINMTPYGSDKNKKEPTLDGVKDFIKFKFYDIVNQKYIRFRAILSGISDSITPEWGGTRYIGRPDKVWVYSGTDRSVSFSFEIYPKTKQEFPVLLEKLNYLIGLCYPSYHNNRMVAPFIELTLGDMFNKTPGFLNSLSIDVDDTGTWEIDEGLQFPKHITCACEFTYIGRHVQATTGKHYELGWLPDREDGTANGISFNNWPSRDNNDMNMIPLFTELSQDQKDD